MMLTAWTVATPSHGSFGALFIDLSPAYGIRLKVRATWCPSMPEKSVFIPESRVVSPFFATRH